MSQQNVIRSNFYSLHSETLASVIAFAAVIGYAWTWSNIWPITGGRAPLSSWVGGCALLFSAVFGQMLKRHSIRLGIYLLMAGISLAAVCATLTFRAPTTIYVLLLPVIFASVFLRQSAFFVIAAGAGLLALSSPYQWAPLPLPMHESTLAAIILFLVAVVAWLSARNLHTTLAWFGDAYEIAYRNEQIAREQQAEQRRLLRALDDATHNLARANQRLTYERNQADSARRMKQQLAQTISHELRTPLNIILGFVDVMAQTPEYYGAPLPVAYRRDLSIIHKNALHLQKLVNDVLDLARVEAAQMGIVPEPTDLYALVNDVAHTCRSLVESQGLELRIDLDDSLPTTSLDQTRIRQVLLNLINNAARFTDEGSVTVRARLQKDHILFSVEDTGVGIAPDNIPRLFQEFQQLDGSTRRKHGGVGLGLAISQRFVQLHNGNLWVKSALGEGSTFYFSLPVTQYEAHILQREADVPHRKADEEMVLLGITTSTAAASLLSRLRPAARTLIVHTLEQARATAASLLPEWIVIDSASLPPDTDLQALAESWNLRETTFIECGLPGSSPAYPAASFDGYLMKPITEETLLDVLRPFSTQVEDILIVDDNRDFVRLVTRILENPLRRYHVTSALSGNEGLGLVQQQRPDLILLDLELPDLHGSAVLERIRALDGGAEIPVIVISGEPAQTGDEGILRPIKIVHSEGLSTVELLQWLQNVVNASV